MTSAEHSEPAEASWVRSLPRSVKRMHPDSHLHRIQRYYDENQILYHVFWTDSKSLSMNYGFWNGRTKRLSQALFNQHREIATRLDVQPSDLVLDAGCGVGGTTIFMAKEYSVRATGITLSAKQAARARLNAFRRGVGHRTSFLVADFTRTGFRSGSFSKIFASESVCHAERKEDFAAEAFRLLKRGGRLVVVDGFLGKDRLDELEQKIYEEWLRGWEVPHLATVPAFAQLLKSAGFKETSFIERTEEIMPSSRRIFWLGLTLRDIIRGLHRIHVLPKSQIAHAVSCIRQYDVLKKRVGVYGIFVAEK